MVSFPGVLRCGWATVVGGAQAVAARMSPAERIEVTASGERRWEIAGRRPGRGRVPHPPHGPNVEAFLTTQARGILAVNLVHVDTVLLRRILRRQMAG